MALRWHLIGYPATVLVLGALLALSGVYLASSAAAPRPAEEALGLAASLAGLALLAWWTAALALALAAEALRRRGHAVAASAAGALTPAFMRRLAAALLGAHLLAVPAGGYAAPSSPVAQIAAAPAAGAQPTDPAGTGGAEADNPQEQPGAPARTPRVSPEWVPLPVPCGPGLLAREPVRQPPAGQSGEVVVRPGDSLWSIAAARLGPLASDAEIAGHWPHWYARNASVIGPDPGLLRPGQVLRAPEGS